MKSTIHPKYYEVTVVCACGASFVTKSTKEELRLEICSECHPFFTGKQKLMDTAGRIERFNKRYAKKEDAPKPPPVVAAAAPAAKAEPKKRVRKPAAEKGA